MSLSSDVALAPTDGNPLSEGMLEAAREIHSCLEGIESTKYRGADNTWTEGGRADPFCFAVYGEWGAGKTSLLQHIEQVYKNKKSLTVWFEPWRYETEEHLILPLLAEFTGVLSAEIQDKNKKKALKKAGKAVIKGVAKILLRSAIAANTMGLSLVAEKAGLKSDDVIDGIAGLYTAYRKQTGLIPAEEYTSEIRQLRGKLLELVELADADSGKVRHPVVIMIDDLDRCDPLQVKRLLESIKLFLHEPGILFFFALDLAQVVKLTANTFANPGRINHDISAVDMAYAKEYLAKFFQLGYDVNALSQRLDDGKTSARRLVVEAIGNNTGADFIKSWVKKVSAALPYNPRTIKMLARRLALEKKTRAADERSAFDFSMAVIEVVFPDIWMRGFSGASDLERNHLCRTLRKLLKKPEVSSEGHHSPKDLATVYAATIEKTMGRFFEATDIHIKTAGVTPPGDPSAPRGLLTMRHYEELSQYLRGRFLAGDDQTLYAVALALWDPTIEDESKISAGYPPSPAST